MSFQKKMKIAAVVAVAISSLFSLDTGDTPGSYSSRKRWMRLY